MLKQNYSQYMTAAAIMYLPMVLLTLLTRRNVDFFPSGPTPAVATVIGDLIARWLWLSLTDAVIVVITSGIIVAVPLDTTAAVKRALRRAWPILAAVIVTGVLSSIGFIFLFVPGIYFFTRFGISSAVAAIEDGDAMKTLQRASRLSYHNKRHYLNTMGMFFILYGVVSGGLSLLLGSTGLLAMGLVSNAIVMVFIFPVLGIAQALLYYDMRIRNEGFDIELMSRRLGLEQQLQPAL